MSARPPYRGPHRKLVLAFDVGTTFSGISYCILDPGEVPEIRGVTRFPAQEQVGGDSKIPTVLYYDQEGNVCAVGAEAAREGIEDHAEDGQWTKAEWFKLHLRPKAQSSAYVTHKIPPLPRGKAAIDIFADFLRYLHKCARTYIEETHANGVEMWSSLKDRTDFVLTHPNGWEGAQQGMMRTAAVRAGLIPDTEDGQSHLSFVTEGEASLHFCVQSGLTNDAIKSGKGLLIVDAGGGTIDISAYRQTSPHTQSYEEIAAPQCHFYGSIFVTGQARKFLDGLLGQSRFSGDIPHIEKCFDKTTKLRFRNADEPQYIKFGTIRDKDPSLNIRSGQLKLLGSDVASFFEPSVQCIVESIKEQREASVTEISSVFLVGGFAASDWLYQNMRAACTSQGLDLQVSRPDSHVNKAVADGAVSFYIDHFVSARVSKFAYGINTYHRYNAYNPEHQRRQNTTFMTAEGYLGISGIFNDILPQNTKVSESQEFSNRYRQVASNKIDLKNINVAIMSYRGDSTKSDKWMDEEKPMYSTLCHVQADTTEICKSLQPQVGAATFYEIKFEVVLALGLTELKAHLSWEENGIKRRSPAEVVYGPDRVQDVPKTFDDV
ncbi:hypothetical protein BYT27DRAFT_7196548 [Phlegmacium glaucopus]|nr:hypothetical protein BYT27DRAFT_7196548 [Phlegmacium glaucopus]